MNLPARRDGSAHLPSARLAATALAALAAVAWPSASWADDLPRYRLLPGQHLVFSSKTKMRVAERTRESTTSAEFWVLARNGDGTHRLMMRTRDGDRPAAEAATLLVFDLTDTGDIRNVSDPLQTDPGIYFPPLPAKAEDLTKGWVRSDIYGEPSRCTPVYSPRDRSFRIQVIPEGPMNQIYELQTRTLWSLDAARGLPEHAEFTATQGSGMNIKTAGTLRLTSLDTLEAADLAKLAADAELLASQLPRYQDQLKSAATDPAALPAAKTILTEAQDKATHPIVRDDLAQRIKQHEAMATFAEQDARDRAAILNQPAFPFSTTDFNDRQQNLADYRGKVVVLDFWYRGCGWCIRAMPQLKELANEFKDDPVIILGMNTDHDPEDGEIVIKTMQLNYNNVHAAGLEQRFGVRAFPTLLIIDRDGIIREIHTGYAPDLRKTVSASIRKLLNNPPAAPQP